MRGGTGWGAEFAKLCNKPLCVFDQEKNGWFWWTGGTGRWCGGLRGLASTFTGTGRGSINAAGQMAIEALFSNSFK